MLISSYLLYIYNALLLNHCDKECHNILLLLSCIVMFYLSKFLSLRFFSCFFQISKGHISQPFQVLIFYVFIKKTSFILFRNRFGISQYSWLQRCLQSYLVCCFICIFVLMICFTFKVMCKDKCNDNRIIQGLYHKGEQFAIMRVSYFQMLPS